MSAESDTERVQALVRRVSELTADIGSVLHANTSILFMAQQSIDVAIRALGPSPFEDTGMPTVHEVLAVLEQPASAAARALDKLVAVLDEPGRQDTAEPRVRDELCGYIALLENPAGLIPIEESRASTLRTVACRVQDLVQAMPAGRLPRELLRHVRGAAHEVERRAAVASLLQTRSAILQMDYTIRSFREFVTTDVRRAEERRQLDLLALFEAAHHQLVEYARSSNVEIRVRNDAPGVAVLGVERDLVRSLANLLHNAIKYTWRRESGQRPWVSVHVRRDQGRVQVALENWGVPIGERELSEGMVFELGYRGKWSTDRGRLGTGIGLTDSREVLEKHGGSLVITSRPARTWGPDDPDDETYYRQPFLTTVTLALPEAL